MSILSYVSSSCVKAFPLTTVCVCVFLCPCLQGVTSAQESLNSIFSVDKFHTVGVKECAACHSGASSLYEQLKVTRFIRLVEANEWMQDKHAYAYELVRTDLTPKDLELPLHKSNQLSILIQERLGWKRNDGHFENQCLTCHTGLNPLATKRMGENAKINVEFGVQCESCHGPGSEYLQTHLHQQVSWRSKTPKEKAEHGMWDLTSATSATQICASCHIGNISQNRYITHAMYAAGHPIMPPFELQTFLDAMPPHWKSIQEKPLMAKTDLDRPERFELQSEYYSANFKLQNQSAQAEASIRASFDRTRRSMIAGLVVQELSLDLLSELGDATDNYRWGDFANYDCMGCHQTLKRNNPKLSIDNRIPGRPFPAKWHSLDFAILDSANREVFHNRTAQMTKVFNKVPFGTRSDWQESRKLILTSRWQAIRDFESHPLDLQGVQAWLRSLIEQRRHQMNDYLVARQTGWMVSVAINELASRRHISIDKVRPSLNELTQILRLELHKPQKESVLNSQTDVLSAATSFDAARCDVLLDELLNQIL